MSAPPAALEGAKLAQLADSFLDRVYAGVENRDNVAAMLRRLCGFVVQGRPLGEWPVRAVTEDALEEFFHALGTFEAGTRTKYAQTLKRLFRWAKRKRHVDETPITEDSTIRGSKGTQRRRRIYSDEEDRLLSVAPPLLQALVIAAVESLCRIGELLALKWQDVSLEKRTIAVAARERGARKTGRARTIPISVRLAAILEMRRTDLAGSPKPAGAYVFGTDVGERVSSIKKAWETAVLKAHGCRPEWVRCNRSNRLSAQSRAKLRAIDLHFHDLRHEGGIRLLEKGWQLHWLQAMYGHTTLAQTAAYLHADEYVLPEVMKMFDGKPSKRGAVVVQTPPVEHPPLHHGETGEDGKSPVH